MRVLFGTFTRRQNQQLHLGVLETGGEFGLRHRNAITIVVFQPQTAVSLMFCQIVVKIAMRTEVNNVRLKLLQCLL